MIITKYYHYHDRLEETAKKSDVVKGHSYNLFTFCFQEKNILIFIFLLELLWECLFLFLLVKGSQLQI